MSDQLRARNETIARFVCARCQGTLVPPPDDAENPFSDIDCIDCGASFRCKGGVLDLVDGSPSARIRRYPFQGRDLDFWHFHEAALQLGAFRDTDLEDELFTLLGWLDHEPGRPLLVLGAGRGELASIVVDACPDSTVVVCDDALDELRAGRQPLARTGLGSWSLVRCDQDRPPLRAGGFSGILSFGLLHGLDNALDHARRLARLLPPGGRLVGVTLARSNLPHIAQAQRAMSDASGLSFIAMEEFGTALMKAGWRAFRHEQPSNFLARFVAIRGPM